MFNLDKIKNLFDWKIVGTFPVKRLMFVWGKDKNDMNRRRHAWQIGSLRIHGPFYNNGDECSITKDIKKAEICPNCGCDKCKILRPNYFWRERTFIKCTSCGCRSLLEGKPYGSVWTRFFKCG